MELGRVGGGRRRGVGVGVEGRERIFDCAVVLK